MNKSKIIYTIPVIFLIIGASILYSLTPIRSYSVQENIVDNGSVYSWEQWCHYDLRNGTTQKRKIATFSVATKAIGHGQLTTDLCSQ